jgi:flavin-dependent thymidylate synthase
MIHKGVNYPVHDHGFVRLVDWMGTDADILKAARVSYASEGKGEEADRKLLKYLFDHKHTSPFEMCLDGDTLIPTAPCKGATVKHYSIRQLAEAEDKGKAGAWAKLIYIRTVDLATGTIHRTKIRRVWKTGTYPAFCIRTDVLDRKITATANHPFLCSDGKFRRLDQLKVGNKVSMNGVPTTPDETINEIIRLRRLGKPCTEISQVTGMSVPTVLKWSSRAGLPDRVKRKTGFLKKPVGTHIAPRAIARRKIPKGPCALCLEPGRDRHHRNENPHDNSDENLIRLCPKHHRHFHTKSILQRVVFDTIKSITPVGMREVYDLETVSDFHNFVAEGFVVHNCKIKFNIKMPIFVMRQYIRHRMQNVNEVSARYTELPNEFFVPEVLRRQDTKNKQGSVAGEAITLKIKAEVVDVDGTSWLSNDPKDLIRNVYRNAYNAYLDLLAGGVAREQARIVLPVGIYTEFIACWDLSNLLKYFALRDDPHAQGEHQDYAKAMKKITAEIFPWTMDIYEKSRLSP